MNKQRPLNDDDNYGHSDTSDSDSEQASDITIATQFKTKTETVV